MTDEEFASACSAIEQVALNNALLLEHAYGTTRADVESVVRMARTLRLKHRGEADRIERA